MGTVLHGGWGKMGPMGTVLRGERRKLWVLSFVGAGGTHGCRRYPWMCLCMGAGETHRCFSAWWTGEIHGCFSGV